MRMRTEGDDPIKNVRHYIEKEEYLSKLLDIAERLEQQDQEEEEK